MPTDSQKIDMSARNKNQTEYEKRVNRVLDHVRAHRSEDLSLEELASVAGFSAFHFHRVFKAMTGENLKEHIQRTRLECAASALVTRPHVDILVIALENGFNSASAFARAFKERFGMSASQWRNGGAPHLRNDGQSDSNLGIAKGKEREASASANEQAVCMSRDQLAAMQEQAMNIKVKTLPTYRVAYIRVTGPYGPGGPVPQAWERLARWASARDLWTHDRICLGIGHDDPKVTDPARCRCDAAIVIADDLVPDGEVNVMEVQGGKYAVNPFVGTGQEVGAAYDLVFGVWLPQSGYQPDDRFMFELYQGEPYNPATGQFSCDVCVPVRPL